ncbi:HAD family hydrolase [Streptomyces bobili]|uniref:HAD family hydrolase n=1 Tax=Streptomyces bobili TaxID=67280 RepID=UPI0033A607A4
MASGNSERTVKTTPLYTQRVIAFVWDFDRTLIQGYMHDPIFREFGVDSEKFWNEVKKMPEEYRSRGLLINQHYAALIHTLSYIREGIFSDLTTNKLRGYGALLTPSPGMPEFLTKVKEFVNSSDRYKQHGIEVEHYVISTGLRPVIEGSRFGEVLDGIWASELIPGPPGAGIYDQPNQSFWSRNLEDAVLDQIGYVLDDTSKTKPIFEINKGVNKWADLDINAPMPEEVRRIPIRNMIYIADGPSDVPVFSVVNGQGGKTLGVYTLGEASNYEALYKLQSQGRIKHLAQANFEEDGAAGRWLMTALQDIADHICSTHDEIIRSFPRVPGHVIERDGKDGAVGTVRSQI